MKNYSIVLGVINHYEDIEVVVKKSFYFAQKFNTSVEIIYVHEPKIFSIEEIFKLEDNTLNKEEVKKYIKEIVSKYTKEADKVAILVDIADTKDKVYDIVKDDPKYLIVSKYHKKITPRLLSELKQSQFVINSDIDDYKNVALLSENLNELEESIKECKEKFDFEITVLYNFVHLPVSTLTPPELVVDFELDLELLETDKEIFKKILYKYNVKGEFLVDYSLDDEPLIEYLKKKKFDCICIGRKDEQLLNNITNEILENLFLDIFRL